MRLEKPLLAVSWKWKPRVSRLRRVEVRSFPPAEPAYQIAMFLVSRSNYGRAAVADNDEDTKG